MTAALLGLGDHRPARVVGNDELDVDTSDEWIRTRTGIATRRIAGAGEGVVDMAVAAAGKALAASGVDPARVGLVLLATCSLPTPLPGGAAEVAHRLGSTAAGAVDLNAACAGFCYGLSWARDAVAAGSAEYVVVAASERLSDWVDWTDRATCVLFGDGAGAAVVGRSDVPGVGPVAWGAEGEHAGLIGTSGGFIRMEGPAVFRWATTALAPVARRACDLAGVEPRDLAAFVPHQANLRIVEALARALDVPRVARDVVDSGNTSSASVPLALVRLVESGEVASGDPVLLLGFGAGLTYAAQVVRVP